MEKIEEEEKKIVFSEEDELGNKHLYTMIDMGSYVGHRSRQWYEPETPYWILMFYDKLDKNGNPISHTESLCDENGQYLRLLISEKDVKRVIQLTSGYVLEDSIYQRKGSDTDFLNQNVYVGFKREYVTDICSTVKDYFSTDRKFVLEETGQEFTGVYPSNSAVINYFDKNEEILKIMNTKTK